jgi:3-oxoacyl-[acyl-carrier protein] reductase
VDLGIGGKRAAVAAGTAGLGYACAEALAAEGAQVTICGSDRSLLAVVEMCTAAVPALRDRGWGRIVAITSLGVRQPYPNLALSNTARAGATGFLRTLAREVAGDGVTVNSVQPGLHATERVRRVYGDGDTLAGVL